MLQVDRAGNVTESVVTAEGDKLRQENVVALADGSTRRQRVLVSRDGDDAFTFTASIPEGEEWVEAVSFKYQRRPAPER